MAKTKTPPAPSRLARMLAAARTACATHAIDLVAAAGAAAVVYGVAQIYAPAGWIVGGAMTLAGVVLYVRFGSVEDVAEALASGADEDED